MIFWPFLALFRGLKYFDGVNLLALAKAECFEDNSFYSLLNFYDGKYVISALQDFFLYFSGKASKSRLYLTHVVQSLEG